MMGKLIEVLRRELDRAATGLPSCAEVQRAKAQLKAGLLMSLESSSARAEQMARQLLVFDRLVPMAELTERVDNVTAESIRALAERLMTGGRPSVAIVGAGRKGQTFARQVERMAEA
jgi:predicted Zn-dependent peptidase